MSTLSKPPYFKPKKSSYTRRARHHNYQAPAKYMITLKKAPQIPTLCQIIGDHRVKDPLQPGYPTSRPNLVGQCFEKALSDWIRRYPQMRVDTYIIMPDHIHFRLHVIDDLPTDFGTAIAFLMGRTTNHYKAHLSQLSTSCPQNLSFFQKGYTDSIAYTSEQFATQKAYILDNPRRLLIKRQYPDFFFTRWILYNDSVGMIAIGNIHLLKNPHITQVRFSRKFSEEEVREHKDEWYKCVNNNGVLISPFIHPVEKEMREYASNNSGRIIRLEYNGFGERYSPSKKDMELLSEGRLLIIGPMHYDSQMTTLSRAMSLHLNALAAWLATYPDDLKFRKYTT